MNIQKKIDYRKANRIDVPQIQSFVDKAKITMENLSIFQWDEIYPTQEDFYFDAEKQELYVGEYNGKIVVCFTLNKFQDEEYFSADWENKNNDFMVVHRLCVNPEFQGQGFGIQTCRYIENLVKSFNCSSIRLDAFSKNPISLSMYKKLGFKQKGYAIWRKGKFFLLEKVLEV